MMKLLKVGVVVATLFGMSTAYAANDTAAANLKVGVLDMQQIMQQSPEVANLNKQLENQFKPRQEKIVSARNTLQSEMEKYKKDASVMSEADKSKTEQKLNADQVAYANEVQVFQQDLSKAQSQAMQKFMANLQAAVGTVAKEGHYSMIVNRAALPYFDPNLDATKEILKAMAK